MEKIGVIIPVRNASHLLDRCLDKFYPTNSLLHQIIIVDCLSTDGIDVVLRRHKTLPIVHLRGADTGIYDAFNKGARAATAPIIFFMGADDIVSQGLFLAAAEFTDSTDVLVGGITQNQCVERWRPGALGLRLLARNIPHQGMILRRSLLQNAPYSTKYPILGDYAWNLQNFWSGTVRYNFSRHVYCEWSPGGLSATRRDLAFESDKPALLLKHAPKLLAYAYRAKRFVTYIASKFHEK